MKYILAFIIAVALTIVGVLSYIAGLLELGAMFTIAVLLVGVISRLDGIIDELKTRRVK